MNLINEMKKNSGVSLDETSVSVVKMMNAESRLIGAFGSLLRELQWIQRDGEPQPINRYGGPIHHGSEGPSEEDLERLRTVDKAKLYKIAMDKLEVVKEEISKTFEKEDKIDKVEKEFKKEEEDDDDDDDKNESITVDDLFKDFSLKKGK